MMIRSMLLASVVLGLFVAGCSSPLDRGSNSPSSEADAQKSLELRIQKTNEVRAQLDQVREALKPVDAVVTDITKALNSRVSVNGKPVDQLQQVIERLRDALNTSSRGLVTTRPDGSWRMDQVLELPLGRPDYHCQTSTLSVIGQTEGVTTADQSEHLSLILLDCASAKPIVLMDAVVHGSQSDVVFYPEVLEKLVERDVEGETCTMRIHKDSFELLCDPMSFYADGAEVRVTELAVLSDKSGVDAEATVSAMNNGAFLGALNFQKHPGKPPFLNFITPEGRSNAQPSR